MPATGTKLREQLHEIGLGPMVEIMDNFIKGLAGWPGPITFTLQAGNRGTVRNMIYAFLHEMDLKSSFKVSSNSSDTLIIDKRMSKASGITDVGHSYAYGSQAQPELPKGNEWIDPDKLFEE